MATLKLLPNAIPLVQRVLVLADLHIWVTPHVELDICVRGPGSNNR